MENARTENTRRLLRLTQRIRVPAGFVALPAMLILARPTPSSLLAGGAVALLGLAMRAWASGYLRKNETLTTDGPYSYTRNPLYLGTLFLGLGAAICAGSPWVVALFGALYVLIYVPVMVAEVDTMIAMFPGEYGDYSRRVPLLVPRPGSSYHRSTEQRSGPNRSASTGFNLALYRRNREYRAALGFATVTVLLVVKMVVLGLSR